MNRSTKIVAMYLPQYHEIPENNAWWGKGYTDWVAVKKATPQYKGHEQPKVPLHGYYKLDEKETIDWQAKLARQYGVDAFGIYHYWFSSDLKLLEKPAEILLRAPEIEIDYMFVWDNSSWKRTWRNVRNCNAWAPSFDKQKDAEPATNGVLAKLDYGNETDWRKHFLYLLPFFRDRRYIKINNQPVFVFFNPYNNADTLERMCNYWDQLAKEEGFDGIRFIFQRTSSKDIGEYHFCYQPAHNGWQHRNAIDHVFKKGYHIFHTKLLGPMRYRYDTIWKRIIHAAEKRGENLYYGAFVNYDDTPRRGKQAKIVINGTPKKFEKYMARLLQLSEEQKRDFLFLTAWNEWGEGAYLEPDTVHGYAYLTALQNAVESVYQR